MKLSGVALSLLLLWLMAGCGYRPASTASKQFVGEHLFVESVIDIKDPQNLVLIQDALNRAISTRFHSSLTERANASAIITVRLESLSFEALAYDRNGYVSDYRANVKLAFKVKRPTASDTYIGRGRYDFPISANAVISDSKRFEAIKQASESAIDGFVAYAAAKGLFAPRR